MSRLRVRTSAVIDIPMSEDAGGIAEPLRSWPVVPKWRIDVKREQDDGFSGAVYTCDPEPDIRVTFSGEDWKAGTRKGTWAGPEAIPVILGGLLEQRVAERLAWQKDLEALVKEPWGVYEDDYHSLDSSPVLEYRGAVRGIGVVRFNDTFSDSREVAEVSYNANNRSAPNFSLTQKPEQGLYVKRVGYKTLEDMAVVLQKAEAWFQTLSAKHAQSASGIEDA